MSIFDKQRITAFNSFRGDDVTSTDHSSRSALRTWLSARRTSDQGKPCVSRGIRIEAKTEEEQEAMAKYFVQHPENVGSDRPYGKLVRVSEMRTDAGGRVLFECA